MDLLQSRIGLLVPSPAAIWTGTADGDQSSSFVLSVTTVTGSLSSADAGRVLVRENQDLVRVRDAGGTDITLAENGVTFAAAEALAIYDLRLPFPRYQRLASGVVYKDYDIAFPTPYQLSVPPSVAVDPGAIWLEVDEQYIFDGSRSRMMHDTGLSGNNDVTLSWDPGTDGTVHAIGGQIGDVINATATISWSSAGFRYLKVTGVDPNSATSLRYVAVWVGESPVDVISFDMSWSIEKGWGGRGAAAAVFTFLEHSPVALVDQESREVLLFGFLHADSERRSFEDVEFDFSILSPLVDAEKLRVYPFLVTDIDDAVETPDDWSEIVHLTVPRAAWFLLYWHTMLPEVANVDTSAAEIRQIKGQKFKGGTIPGLMDEVIGAAKYVARASQVADILIEKHPLYAESARWTSGDFAVFDLSDAAQRENEYDYQHPEPRFTDTRWSGVYAAHTGSFEPAIARAPTNPANWGGGTNEVNNMAPLSELELHRWVSRHFVVENLVPRVTMRPLVNINPYTYQLVDTGVSEASRVMIERLSLNFNPGALAWVEQFSGRPYGDDVEAVSIPIPPAIEVPVTPAPSPTPPVYVPPSLPPAPPWPVELYVATQGLVHSVYHTTDFTGTDDLTQPTWTDVGDMVGPDHLSNYVLWHLHVDPLTPITKQYVGTWDGGDTTDYTLYKRTDGGLWTSILTTAIATSTVGSGNTCYVRSFDICGSTGYIWAGVIDFVGAGMYVIRSIDGGSSWSLIGTKIDTGTTMGPMRVYAPYVWMVRNNDGFGAWTSSVWCSDDNGATWNGISVGGLSVYPYLHMFDDRPHIAYYAGGSDLIHVWDRSLGITDVTYNPGPALWRDGKPAYWTDPNTPLYHCFMHFSTGRIYETEDYWTTLKIATPTVTSPIVTRLLVPNALVPDNTLLGRITPSEMSVTFGTIYVLDDRSVPVLLDKSGIDPSNMATTVSIPGSKGVATVESIAVVQ